MNKKAKKEDCSVSFRFSCRLFSERRENELFHYVVRRKFNLTLCKERRKVAEQEKLINSLNHLAFLK